MSGWNNSGYEFLSCSINLVPNKLKVFITLMPIPIKTQNCHKAVTVSLCTIAHKGLICPEIRHYIMISFNELSASVTRKPNLLFTCSSTVSHLNCIFFTIVLATLSSHHQHSEMINLPRANLCGCHVYWQDDALMQDSCFFMVLVKYLKS